MNFRRPWWWVLLLLLGFGFITAARMHDDLYTTKYAVSLAVKGDAAGAVREYDKYLEKFPNDASALFDRGQNYMALKQIDLAIADFSASLKLRPDSSFARYARASAYYSKKDYDAAIADFTLVTDDDLKFGNYGNYYRRGMSYQRAGRFGQALADFDTFLSHYPNQKYVVRARECARQMTNEGECRTLPDTSDPELARSVEKMGRCQFQHQCD